jgi:hypothetical protein
MMVASTLHSLQVWSPVWNLLVAVGTLGLAAMTGWLAWATRSVVRESRAEVAAIGRQVGVEERQLALAIDPMVWPVTPVEWARGEVAGRGVLLHLKNGGGGPALDAEGEVHWLPEPGGERKTSKILPVTIAGGDEAVALLDKPIESYGGARGAIRYGSIDKKSWQTDFLFDVVGGIVTSRVWGIIDRTLPVQAAAAATQPPPEGAGL